MEASVFRRLYSIFTLVAAALVFAPSAAQAAPTKTDEDPCGVNVTWYGFQYYHNCHGYPILIRTWHDMANGTDYDTGTDCVAAHSDLDLGEVTMSSSYDAQELQGPCPARSNGAGAY